ncbi:MAG: DUF721 domain-containing protein [Flavobacteriaceae bacterium]|nr:DUF721 domain-containing protein [Flavobacteriaceae bacterium]
MSKKRENEINTIENILKIFLKENKLSKGLQKINIREIWSEVMGKGVEAYTTNVELRGNIVVISLSSSVLREELNAGKNQIIISLNKELEDITIKNILFI